MNRSPVPRTSRWRFGVTAPALAGQHLNLAFSEVHPEEAEARHEGNVVYVRAAWRRSAVEVKFVVSNEMGAFVVAVNAESDAEFCGLSEILTAWKPGRCYTECWRSWCRYSTGVLVAPGAGEVHETDRRDADIA